MVLAARCWRTGTFVSKRYGLISKPDAYIDTSSPSVMKIHKTPTHTTMKPYTNPAGPPLFGLCQRVILLPRKIGDRLVKTRGEDAAKSGKPTIVI